MKIHMCIPIEVEISRIEALPIDEREEYCKYHWSHSHSEVMQQLEDMKKAGLEVISCAECDNKLPNGRCGGHQNNFNNNQ